MMKKHSFWHGSEHKQKNTTRVDFVVGRERESGERGGHLSIRNMPIYMRSACRSGRLTHASAMERKCGTKASIFSALWHEKWILNLIFTYSLSRSESEGWQDYNWRCELYGKIILKMMVIRGFGLSHPSYTPSLHAFILVEVVEFIRQSALSRCCCPTMKEGDRME